MLVLDGCAVHNAARAALMTADAGADMKTFNVNISLNGVYPNGEPKYIQMRVIADCAFIKDSGVLSFYENGFNKKAVAEFKEWICYYIFTAE